jgi:hypothetical protein
MPATYTPSPTNVESPASAPSPDNLPLVSLPLSGEGDTVASIGQAFKVLADFISWLLDRFAIASNWTQRIDRWRNARSQTRALVTHPGFVEGKVLAWQESWDLNAPFKGAVGLGPWFGKWAYSISGDTAGGSIATNIAFVGPPTFGGGPTGTNTAARTSNVYLATAPTGTHDSAQEIEAPGQIILDDDTCVAMQWDAQIGGTPAVAEDTMGIITGSLGGATGTTLSNAPFGAWFENLYNPSGPTYIHCRWQGATGGIGLFNPFIILTSGRHRFRIEIYGANVSDDSTARVLFYLDGALVRNQAVDFTNATSLGQPAVATPFFRHDETSVGGISWLNIQAVDFRANTWAGDVSF